MKRLMLSDSVRVAMATCRVRRLLPIDKPLAARGRGARFLLNSDVAGPFAWFGGEPGQVGNEAAIVVQNQCRSQARHCLNIPPGPPALSNAGTLFPSVPTVIWLHIPMTSLVL